MTSEENSTVGKKVLIIEDTREIRLSLVAAFEADDYDVVSADTGRRGLIAFANSDPDLVVTDLRMPDFDGAEVTARIRRVSEVPIIVLSAIADPQLKVECLEAGADDYLVKGVGMDELLARAKRQLARARTRPAIESISAVPLAQTEPTARTVVEAMNIVIAGVNDKPQKGLVQNLRYLGHDVAVASSFDEALQHIGTTAPQLVMVNMNLTASKPLRLARYISLNQIAPVILVAESITPALRARSRILKVADIVAPSISESELAMRIGWAQSAGDRVTEKQRTAQLLKRLQEGLREAG